MCYKSQLNSFKWPSVVTIAYQTLFVELESNASQVSSDFGALLLD